MKNREVAAVLNELADTMELLGEDRYRVWTNNCEHFVHWCLSGTARSAQVERWGRRLRGALGAFAAPGRLVALRTV